MESMTSLSTQTTKFFPSRLVFKSPALLNSLKWWEIVEVASPRSFANSCWQFSTWTRAMLAEKSVQLSPQFVNSRMILKRLGLDSALNILENFSIFISLSISFFEFDMFRSINMRSNNVKAIVEFFFCLK